MDLLAVRINRSQNALKAMSELNYSAFWFKMFAEKDPNRASKPDIKWNFTKLLIDREGNVAARFEPTVDMADVENCIKALL